MKKILSILFLLVLIAQAKAQEQLVQGVVFDKDTHQRLAKVYIYNTRNEHDTYNTNKGEFSIPVKLKDTLVIALQGYAVDTIVYNGQKALIVNLKSLSIRLKEVVIRDSIRNPKDVFAAKKKEYKQFTDPGKTDDALRLGPGGTGVGLSIDVIYSLLSRQGRNARNLQKIIERDYKESMIDYRFTPYLVSSVTGLKDSTLTDFIQQYRPSYEFILKAGDYELISYIKLSYKRYMSNPAAYRLPPLPPIKIDTIK